MMLANDIVRVALATTHLPLRAVADAIDAATLARTLRIVRRRAARATSASPIRVIAVLGLNPHAGEDGHLGREEIDVITPVIDRLRARRHAAGRSAAGGHRVPAGEAAAVSMRCWRCTTTRACRCSSTAASNSAVNLTLGLPYPRVAVDHGTALDIAGSGRADPSSLFAAIQACTRLAATRRARRERA